MSAGRELAADLLIDITDEEQALLKYSNDSFIEGFLIGKFGREWSRVSLYNAVSHLKELLP